MKKQKRLSDYIFKIMNRLARRNNLPPVRLKRIKNSKYLIPAEYRLVMQSFVKLKLLEPTPKAQDFDTYSKLYKTDIKMIGPILYCNIWNGKALSYDSRFEICLN